MDENTPKSKLINSLLSFAIIFGILALFAFIATPNFVNKHRRIPKNACINNLRQIDAATQQWALENNKTNSATVVTWTDIRAYLGRGPRGSLVSIYCPEERTKTASNSYTLGDFGSPPKCKINPTHILP